MRAMPHDDDLVLVFEATQESRHAALLRANEIARALVERMRSKAAGQVADDDGAVAGPGRLRVVVGEAVEDKTVKQRAFLHKAVFPQISEQVTFPDGQRFEWRVWKEMFRARFLGDRWELRADPRWDPKLGQYVIPKRKTPKRVRVSTEGLSIKQYSAYIDTVIDTAVLEFGVVFEFIATQREEVRYVKPTRRKAPEKATA